MLNQSVKSKAKLKNRAYQYSVKKIDSAELECLLSEAQELANIPGSSILTLKGKR
jgi:hypothetical protein